MLENITFSYFAEQVVSHPALLIAVLLTLGVILVNGWTDAPNAIATCVSTRCIDVDKAIIMAAACNFLGVLIMSLVNSKVAMTIKNMVNFGGDTDSAMIALCAAMTAIVIWAIGAWAFGIPTSESHALIAGLTGAAIALQGGLDGVNPSECCQPFSDSQSDLWCASCSRLSVTALTEERQMLSSQKHRWPARRRWHSCTEPRTVRSSWEFSCLGCFS